MQKICFSAVAESPILASNYAGTSNHTTCLGYIPGSLIRGALAARFLENRSAEDGAFLSLFLEKPARFSDLYPWNGRGRVGSIPSTARSCKRFPGFAKEGQKTHGVVDRAFRLASGDLLPDDRCNCNEVLTGFNAFCYNFDGAYTAPDVIKRLFTKSGVERATHTVSQGILYSSEVIAEGTMFFGEILISDSQQMDLVRQLLFERPLRVGEGRSRGFGKLVCETVAQPELASVSQRIALFNKHFAKLAGQKDSETIQFCIDCQSDVILTDEFGRLPQTISPEYFSLKFGLEGKLGLVYDASSVITVAGWNSAWGLPKQHQKAIRRGSTFVYEYSGDAEKLAPVLAQLEEDGIGARRAEGFGRVLVCDPFHWEVSTNELKKV